MKLLVKIRRKLTKLRLQPIRVFCFHQVSEVYDPLLAWECDWSQTEQMKANIRSLQQTYQFISLTQAQEHLRRDWFRGRKYAVLTADDGYKSLQNILPWLEKEQIPIALFINAHYMDGKSWSVQQEEQSRRAKADVDMASIAPKVYLSVDDIASLTSSNISIASHGYDHVDATKQTKAEFEQNISACVAVLKNHPRYIPFHAFTWGRDSKETVSLLRSMGLTPVFCSGADNYNTPDAIDRVVIDGMKL